MKKYFKYGLFCLFTLFFFTINVKAETIKQEDIPNATYVIGTHMFTRDTNENYDGKLTTKLIMLAAKTIEGDTLDDMVIYYKNPRGKWMDALVGEQTAVPSSFNVEHLNVEVFSGDVPTIETPKITKSFAGAAWDYSEIGYWLNLTVPENVSEVEVYSSASENGEYSLLKTVSRNDINNKIATNQILLGYTEYYKVRYVVDSHGKKFYSDDSNVVECSNELTVPQLTIRGGGSDGEGNSGLLFSIKNFKQAITGVELYYSTSEKGEYTLISTELNNQQDNITMESNSVPLGVTYYYKIRLYKEYESETKYSDYSNIIKFDNSIAKPQVTMLGKGGTGDGQTGFDFSVSNLGGTTGVEIYYAEEKNAEFNLLKTVNTNDIVDNKINITEEGKHYYYKIRLYKEIDETIYYSDFSDVFDASFHFISYNLNGGVANNNINFFFGTTTEDILLMNPTKGDSIFIGWTGSNGNTPEQNVVIPKGTNNNLNYIANWRKKGDVDGDGEVRLIDASYILKSLTVDYNPSDYPDIQLEYGDVNEDGVVDEIDADIISNYTAGNITSLPYHEKGKYKISYNLNGGNFENYARRSYTELTTNMVLAITRPVKEGYTFIGWTGSNGDKPELTLSIPEGTTGDLLYVANWKKQEETGRVLGDVDGDGKVRLIDASYILKSLTLDYNPSDYPDIQLEYGDVNEDGVVDEIDADIISNYTAGNITSLPYHEKGKYKISYDLNGGNFENYARQFYTELTTNMVNIVLTKPVKEGYTFIGWTRNNGDKPELILSIPEGTIGDLEYTANWKVNE